MRELRIPFTLSEKMKDTALNILVGLALLLLVVVGVTSRGLPQSTNPPESTYTPERLTKIDYQPKLLLDELQPLPTTLSVGAPSSQTTAAGVGGSTAASTVQAVATPVSAQQSTPVSAFVSPPAKVVYPLKEVVHQSSNLVRGLLSVPQR